MDLDGVVNSQDYFFGVRRPEGDRELRKMIDPETIPHLNQIIERTGALVVISSSWRLVHRLPDIRGALNHHGFVGKVVSKTGYSREGDSTNRRGLEIQAWIDAEECASDEPRGFVILDDSRDMGRLLPYLVNTTWEHGLLAEHVEPAVKILLEGP